ncbi:MAG TPA: CRISPR-associated protein Cas4 [Candidatus Thermoplasmatota archaeon]|nr:CRISPR-associated protein Cas4 [Candidatus Thermoplasmatota archaeon]
MGYSAADVERFTYCPLSWALAKRGQSGSDEALARGEAAHEAVGKSIRFWRRVLDDHYESLRVALYLALTAASAMTLAFEVLFLDLDGPYHWIFVLMSLTWLMVSLGFLMRALWKEQEAKDFVAKTGLVEGELAYSDLDKPGETLRSAKYELAGKPDYIVRRRGSYIPVELKTGRTPDAPHDSHLMQLGVYCLLVEETYGARPTHGVLQYPERAFEVPFTQEFRDKVLETTLRMRMAEMTGVIHRNHERPGKCRGCSRRDGCPERLG